MALAGRWYVFGTPWRRRWCSERSSSPHCSGRPPLSCRPITATSPSRPVLHYAICIPRSALGWPVARRDSLAKASDWFETRVGEPTLRPISPPRPPTAARPQANLPTVDRSTAARAGRRHPFTGSQPLTPRSDPSPPPPPPPPPPVQPRVRARRRLCVESVGAVCAIRVSHTKTRQSIGGTAGVRAAAGQN